MVCEEYWKVSMGKKTFELSDKQVALLKKATTAGSRGIVWFKDFGISIPHISYIEMSNRDYFRLEGGVKHKIGRSEYERLSKNLV